MQNHHYWLFPTCIPGWKESTMRTLHLASIYFLPPQHLIPFLKEKILFLRTTMGDIHFNFRPPTLTLNDQSQGVCWLSTPSGSATGALCTGWTSLECCWASILSSDSQGVIPHIILNFKFLFTLLFSQSAAYTVIILSRRRASASNTEIVYEANCVILQWHSCSTRL